MQIYIMKHKLYLHEFLRGNLNLKNKEIEVNFLVLLSQVLLGILIQPPLSQRLLL